MMMGDAEFGWSTLSILDASWSLSISRISNLTRVWESDCWNRSKYIEDCYEEEMDRLFLRNVKKPRTLPFNLRARHAEWRNLPRYFKILNERADLQIDEEPKEPHPVFPIEKNIFYIFSESYREAWHRKPPEPVIPKERLIVYNTVNYKLPRFMKSVTPSYWDLECPESTLVISYLGTVGMNRQWKERYERVKREKAMMEMMIRNGVDPKKAKKPDYIVIDIE